jgi:predicted permease
MTIHHTLRALLRTPVFTIAVILTLVLGMGSAASMFAIVHGVLLAPLPYGEPDRLVSVSLQGADQLGIGQPPAVFTTYQQFAPSLDGIGYYRSGSTNVWTEGDDGAAESVVATWVTSSMFPVLQFTPLLGRTFSADEEFRGGPNAVILSESEWRTRYLAAPDIIGKTLVVNSAPRQIVGVMPEEFSFPTSATRIWLPVKLTDSGMVEDFSYAGVARLAPETTAEQAQSELAAVLPRLADLFPRLKSGGSTSTWLTEANPRPRVMPLREAFTGDISSTLWILAGAGGLVLLVAWANAVNLMLIRADGRQLELGVREALGASRLRLVLHFLGESLVLGMSAGVLALVASYGAVKALVALGPADVPRLAELGVGWTTASFVALVTIAGVLLCVAVPMLRARRGKLSTRLHDGARGQTTGKSRQRLRATITVVQIAMALVVTVGSALLLRTAQRLHEVQPGFDASAVTTLRILLPLARYHDATTVAFYARLTESVRQLPSVSAAGLIGQLPLGPGWVDHKPFVLDGARQSPSLPINIVGDGYFAALKIPLLAGRDFRRLDTQQDSDIVVSQRAAETLFGDPNAAASIGKSLTLAPNGPTYTIVGVVGDVRARDLAIAPSPMIYRPLAVPSDPNVEPAPRPSMVLVVRSSGPPGAVIPEIRQILHDLDPTVPIFDAQTMDDVVRGSMARLALTLTLMTAAAAITLAIGAIGLYAVMAWMVALRTREFGVRIALGADPKLIARLVILRGLVLTACGVVLGYVLYAFAAPFLRAFLFGVTVTDPATLVAATLVLVATATFASWLPAQRAARITPTEALRAE